MEDHEQVPVQEDVDDLNSSPSPTTSRDQMEEEMTGAVKRRKKHGKHTASRCLELFPVFFLVAFFTAAIGYQVFSRIDLSNTCETSVAEQEDFIFNKQLWIYQTDNPNYLAQLQRQNHKRFARLSNFDFKVITKDNFRSFLSVQGNRRLDNILNILRQRTGIDKTNLKSHLGSIEKMLTTLSILYEKGGLMLQNFVTITEDFDWIRTIRHNIYVNRGNPGAKPKVVGFFAPFYSPEPRKQNKQIYPGMQDVERYMIMLPTIQNYFIAAEQKSQFINALIEQAIDILTYPDRISTDISTGKYHYVHIDANDIYYQYLLHAAHRVVKKKQDQLDGQHRGLVTRTFAIDYYGLNLLNCYYGPYKLHVNLRYVFPPLQIQSFARLDLEEFQANVGPMRYIQVTTIPTELNAFLTQLKNGSSHQKGVMKGSFVQRMYFPKANQSFIYPNPQQSFVNSSALAWEKLPKIIWFYWDSGLTNKTAAPSEIIIFSENLKKKAQASGFQLRQVNSSNIMNYLSKETIDTINNTITKGKRQVYIQTKSDLYRLAFLYYFGGIYLDASMIPLENFDWLVNIARFPSKYIYNRFGQVPDVFLFWDQNFGGLFQWQVSQTYHTKKDWRFSIQNSFIAANKESEFIKEWYDLLLELLMMPMEDIYKMFEEYKIMEFKWTTADSYYLLSMDAAKIVLGRREKALQQAQAANNANGTRVAKWQGSMDYYKIWSLNCLLGFFKFRSFTNYDNEDRIGLNRYLTRYSQEYAEGILGKVHFIIKIIGEDRPNISGFMIDNSGDLTRETHSQSIFRKYLYDERYTRFELNSNGMRVLKLD